MYVVDSEQRLSGQGLCFICEKAIDHPKEKAVRTGHDFDPLFHTPLAGDKFLCQGCIETAGAAIGLTYPEAAEVDPQFKAALLDLQTLAGDLVLHAQGLPESASAVPVTATKEKDGVKA